ncbi:MAG: LamG domain-containing protein, partial [Cyanobacteriota bacterium]
NGKTVLSGVINNSSTVHILTEVSSSSTITPSPIPSPLSTPSVTTVPTNGLLAYYPFNGNANDMSGNALNAQVQGAVLTNDKSGKSSAAYSFNGTNAYIKIPKIPLKNFTITYFFNSTQKPLSGGNWYDGNGMVDAENCGYVNDWGTSLIDNGQIAFGIGGTGDITIKSTKSYNDGNWHFVSAVKSETVIKLYVDGVLEKTGTGNTLLLDSPTYITAGNSPCNLEGNNRWFKGAIDSIRFYGRELTLEEINAVYKTIE